MKATKGIFLFLLLAVLLTGCAPKAVQKEIFAMDTVMTLTAYGKHAEDGLNAAVAEINAAQRELDPELEGSVVWQLNHADGAAVPVSRFVYNMLQTAKEVYTNSGGALDLTVYPAVKAWGFIDGQYTVPARETLDSLKESVDFSAVALWEEHDTCFVQMPAGMELSFGAAAKGAMAQNVVDTLKSSGAEHSILSLGGNVQTLGLKPDNTAWNIAVQDPNDPAGVLGILSIGETAVVTSGSYQRYFEADGKVYHHILDPATLSPADSGLVSVTVVCRDGAMADCLSTALFVLGEEGAIDYWRTYGGMELLKTDDGEPYLGGGFDLILVTTDGRVVLTKGLKPYFHPDETDYAYQYID